MAKTHLSDLDLEQPGIEAGEINSQLAPAGQVLTADGHGGAGWSPPQARTEASALVIGDPGGGSVGANAIDVGSNRAPAHRASGDNSIVIGQGTAYALAASGRAVVIGYSAQAKGGVDAVVIGAGASTQGNQCVLVGALASGESDRIVGIGYGSYSGQRGVAVGYRARSGYAGISIGYQADTRTNQTEGGLAIGAYAAAIAADGIAIGSSAGVLAPSSIAIGCGAQVSAAAGTSVVIGGGSVAMAQDATLVGYGNIIHDGFSDTTAVGRGVGAHGKGFTGVGSRALGGIYAVALGHLAQANANSAVALGKSAVANVTNGLAIGPGVSNSVANSLKIGWNNTTGFAHFTTFTPSAGAPAATHFLPVILGGATFKLLLAS